MLFANSITITAKAINLYTTLPFKHDILCPNKKNICYWHLYCKKIFYLHLQIMFFFTANGVTTAASSANNQKHGGAGMPSRRCCISHT